MELARIVNRNRQPADSASADRVGNTDYFAGLDDFGTAPAPAPAPAETQQTEPQSGVRVEPQFQDFAPAPVVAPAPEAVVDATRPDTGFEQPAAYAAPEVSIAPTGPQAPAPVAPEVDLGLDIPDSRLDSGVALDLEANLTAELEDELQDVFRASFSPERDAVTDDIAVAPAVSVPDVQDLASAAQAYVPVEPVVAPEVETPEVQTPDFEAPHPGASLADTAARDVAEAPSASPPFGKASFGFDQPQHVAAPGASFQDTAPAPEAAEPAAQSPVDTSLEDELFAALDPVVAKTSAPVASQADFDSLLSDLPSSTLGAATAKPQAADDIDDMTWPAAAAAVPDVPDEETPPPPGGYDLDAVAKAMQESDPTLSGSGVLPPHPQEEKEAAPHAPSSRKGLYAAAAVMAVAVVGAGVFFFADGDTISVPDGPPPVIAGLEGPLKVYPEENTEQADNSSSKLIYDRVGNTNDPSRERLVLPEKTAPAELPPAPEGTTGADPLVPGAPKKVRTLVVRPDGTIVAERDTAAVETPSAPAPQPAAPAVVTPVPVTPDPTTPRTVTTSPVTQPSAPASDDGNVATAPLNGTPVNGAAVNVPSPAVPANGTPETTLSTPSIVATPESATPVQPADIPSVLPKKKPAAPVRVAAAPAATSGPLDLNSPAPATPAPAAPTAAAPAAAGSIPAGTYVVQVTSQRSQAAARDAYSGLQRRFPQVLGNQNAVIVAAEIPDRGTFYRARIPMNSRDAAISLCESLQAAGGDCFVRRN